MKNILLNENQNNNFTEIENDNMSHNNHPEVSNHNLSETKRKKLMNVMNDLVMLKKKLEQDK